MHVSPPAYARLVARDVARLRDTAWTHRQGLLAGTVALVLALSSVGASALSRNDMAAPAGVASAAQAAADESGALKPAADALLARVGTSRPALIDAGQAALRAGRNDATIAAFLRLRWVGRFDAGLERYAARLDAADLPRLALAVAGIQHYSELIHRALLADGPGQLITVSLHDEHLIAYDRGRVVVDTPVTTGRPSLPTDVGAMHVVSKDSPWTMHSPWPKGSPYWYPDTQVQMVVWFTSNGEGMHDASWQPPGTYGPGSTDGPFASHGCIHVPLSAETTLFTWAAVGMPVVVYPGDGAPLSAQVARQSVDAMGNPINGVRGA
jgi:lipoprotein-anchoring transpeptidase ErfK/SrfK